MILHLVTDRRRLSAAADEHARAACLLAQVEHAVAAGIDVIQLREPDLEAAALRRLAVDVRDLLAGTATRFLINDRLDVALAVGAHGVHLRATSMPAVRVRAVAPPGFIVGRSVHSTDDAVGAGPVDYLTAGSVWLTSAKPPGHPAIGVSGLAEIVAVATVPVIAIGGVRPDRRREVLEAGAAGIAAIGAWMQAPPGADGCRAVSLHGTALAFRHGE